MRRTAEKIKPRLALLGSLLVRLDRLLRTAPIVHELHTALNERPNSCAGKFVVPDSCKNEALSHLKRKDVPCSKA